MKIFGFLFLSLFVFGLDAQVKNSSLKKVDSIRNMSMDDVLAALKVSGIQINKFTTGAFDQKLDFEIILEEYQNDTLIETKVLYHGKNYYKVFNRENQSMEKYIDQIRVISKEQEDRCELVMDINGASMNREFFLKKSYNRQFFKWYPFVETHWLLNEKTPLMVYVSSWQDKRGMIRLCGPRQLINWGEDTKYFLSRSPLYFVLSYLVKE